MRKSVEGGDRIPPSSVGGNPMVCSLAMQRVGIAVHVFCGRDMENYVVIFVS